MHDLNHSDFDRLMFLLFGNECDQGGSVPRFRALYRTARHLANAHMDARTNGMPRRTKEHCRITLARITTATLVFAVLLSCIALPGAELWVGIAMLSALLGCLQTVPTEPDNLKSSAHMLRARMRKLGARALLLFCFCTCVFIATSHYNVMKSNASLQLALAKQQNVTLEATELGEYKNLQVTQLQNLLNAQQRQNKELDNRLADLQHQLHAQQQQHVEDLVLAKSSDNCWTRLWLS